MTRREELIERAVSQGVIPSLGGPPDGHLMQCPAELADLILWLETRAFEKRYLEIGVGYGGLMKFMDGIGWRGFGIDPLPPLDVPKDRVLCERSDSEAALQCALSRSPWGFILIDGDHHYDAVFADWDRYRPLSDIIVFHDIEGLRGCDGVRELWHRISTRYGGQTIKFIDHSAGEHRAGIGVWYK